MAFLLATHTAVPLHNSAPYALSTTSPLLLPSWKQNTMALRLVGVKLAKSSSKTRRVSKPGPGRRNWMRVHLLLARGGKQSSRRLMEWINGRKENNMSGCGKRVLNQTTI